MTGPPGYRGSSLVFENTPWLILSEESKLSKSVPNWLLLSCPCNARFVHAVKSNGAESVKNDICYVDDL
ncbi:hypothetical protein TNCV_3492501 [Trichonephila clavipes]|nr:hypothetical protein TNCV_3492501 [Trichonephila clavipes]